MDTDVAKDRLERIKNPLPFHSVQLDTRTTPKERESHSAR